MEANGQQIILSATPGQIRMLESKLTSGSRYPFALRLGSDFKPDEMPAFLRRAEGGFEVCVEAPLRYGGADAQLRKFADRGGHSEQTLEQLFAFVRTKFGQSSTGSVPEERPPAAEQPQPAQGPLREASRITDLAEAGRRLDRRGTEKRLLIRRDRLAQTLKRNIRGQDAVLDVLADRVGVELAKSLRSQPLSFFLFGPSGVGKTETALALARTLSLDEFGVPHRLVRHNMNEYQERHSAYRFVGAPPSYVGYGDEPLLFRELRISPRLVVVFDEIEKAHPDILKTLMALVDTGELSCPSAGQQASSADFRQCILIFTSNISGADVAGLSERFSDLGSVEFQVAARELLVQRRMPPEVVGRIRTLLLYRPLAARDLLAIFADKIQACGQAFGLTVLRVSPVLLADLAARASSTQFGVRIAEQLVEQTLAGEFLRYLESHPGRETVEVAAADDKPVVIPA